MKRTKLFTGKEHNKKLSAGKQGEDIKREGLIDEYSFFVSGNYVQVDEGFVKEETKTPVTETELSKTDQSTSFFLPE
jgi:hypothetical protein